MNVKEIIQHIEAFAPLTYQESYDNAGLIVGYPDMAVTGAIICLDAIEVVVDEAIAMNCNLIIAHHPIVFSGLKKFNGKNYIERVVMKAIQNNIAIYAAHTNLDNVKLGVNNVIAERLGLHDIKILDPKRQLLKKLYTYVPKQHKEQVLDALFAAGAGHIGNYSECSFSVSGQGSFRANDKANPFVGEKEHRHHEEEYKIEVIFPEYIERKVLDALRITHPYEEVAYEIIRLENTYQEIGSGMYGKLATPMEERDFLYFLKEKMNTTCIRHTTLLNKKIETVALCGGAGSFLLNKAIAVNADIFITGDFKYHQFFDADGRILIADIGHFESEQFTSQLFYTILKEKFPNFALHLTKIITNPINYI